MTYGAHAGNILEQVSEVFICLFGNSLCTQRLIFLRGSFSCFAGDGYLVQQLAVVIEQHGDGRISRNGQENFYRLATDVADAEVIVSAANAGNTEVTERIGDVAGLHFAQVDVGELHRLT